MEKFYTKALLEKELELAQEIFADKEYEKMLKIQAFKTRSKRSFWNMGLSQTLKLILSSKRT